MDFERTFVEYLHETGAHVYSRHARNAIGQGRARGLLRFGLQRAVVALRLERVVVGIGGFRRCRVLLLLRFAQFRCEGDGEWRSLDGITVIRGFVFVLVDVSIAHDIDDVLDFVQCQIIERTERQLGHQALEE